MAVHALPFAVPAGLLKQAELGADWADWLDRLPGLYRAMVAEWELTGDGAPLHGFASLVVPVRTGSARPAMLKLTFDGDDESLHEGLALQRWNGSGTVRLLRHEPRRRALLLERLHPEDLNTVPVIEACELVAGLYRRLHIPAFAQLRTVASYVGRWLDELAELPRNAPIPRRLVEQAEAVGRPLISAARSAPVVIHGDLHYANVLAGDREPWLVIDPKPMSGDRHYEPAPMLWNRWDEVVATGNVRSAVRHRFHTLVDTAELDEDLARDWVVVRMVINAHWSIQDAQRAQRDLRSDERAWITECIAIAKAVQD